MTGTGGPGARRSANPVRRRRLTSAAALLAAWLGPIAATIVATPYVLDRIGPAEYGLLTIVLGLVVSMAAIGMSRPLAISTAGDGAADVRRSVVWGVGAAVVGSLAVASLAAVVPLTWLVGREVDSGHARLAVLAGAFAVLGTALMTTVTGRLIGGSRFVAVGSITALVGVATSVGYVALASLDRTAIALVLWNGAVTCGGAALLLWAGRRRPAPAVAPEAVTVGVPSMWPFVIVQLAGNLAILVERVGLAATTDLETVTTYVVPHTMVLIVHGGLVWLTAPLLTRAVRLVKVGDSEGLIAAYQRASRVAVAIAVLAAVSLAVVGHTLLERWLGGESVLGRGPFVVLTVYAAGLSVSVVAWNFADATGNAAENARIGAVWLGFVVVGAVASRWFGVDATVIARAALALTLPVYLRRVERRSLGRTGVWSGAWIVRIAAVGAVVAVGEWWTWAALGRDLPAVGAALVVGALLWLALVPRDVVGLRSWRAETW